MDLISAMDQILLASNAAISVQINNCLHTIDRLNACDVCARACPVGAISLNDEPRLDSDKCTNCGLCLRMCSVGAFRGDDGVEVLFRSIQSLGKVNSLELSCDRHPIPELGPTSASIALKTDRCLASLGPSVYLSLFMMGIFKISIRVDACSGCRLSRACEYIRQAVTSVNTFSTSAFGDNRLVVELIESGPQPDWVKRAVVDVKRPPMSRKAFLTNMFTPSSLTGIARYVTETADPEAVISQPSRERQRLAKALSLYGEVVSPERKASLGQLMPVTDLQVAEACDGCGVCATMCRTGALEFVADKYHRFQLLFSPVRCSGCGVCRDYCEAGAISLHRSAVERSASAEGGFLDHYPVISGELLRCERCHAYFKPRTGVVLPVTSDLCPVCDFRRSNPFGFTLPRNNARLQNSRHIPWLPVKSA